LQKQEEEEHQLSQQVTRALILEVRNMLDEYQNENNKKKGRRKTTTERSLRNPEAWLTLMI
jgi:hypothetical protein